MPNSNLSLANRKQLADLLGNKYEGLRRKALDKFRENERVLKNSLTTEYAEKKGASRIVVQIKAAEQKVKELRRALSDLDFCLDSDLDLGVVYCSDLYKLIDGRIEKEIGSRDAIEARFDSSQLAMMTVASLEDAKAILDSVSELCK